RQWSSVGGLHRHDVVTDVDARVDPRRVVKNAPAVLPKKVEGVFVVDDRVGEHGERFSGLAVVAHDNDLGVTCGQVGFGGDDVGGELGVHQYSLSFSMRVMRTTGPRMPGPARRG